MRLESTKTIATNKTRRIESISGFDVRRGKKKRLAVSRKRKKRGVVLQLKIGQRGNSVEDSREIITQAQVIAAEKEQGKRIVHKGWRGTGFVREGSQAAVRNLELGRWKAT